MKKKSYKSLLFIIIIFSGMFFLSKQSPVFGYFFNNIVFLDKHSPSFSSAKAFMDLEFMAKYSDLVIVGEVVSNGVVEHKTIDRSESEIEKDNRLGIKPLGYDVTRTKIKVKEVISGRCKNDEIIISQLGMLNNDDGETKVKKGKTMILLLNKHPNEEILYSSVNLNDGIYEVKDSGKIGVLSDEEDFKKYEDMGKEGFIKEVDNLGGSERGGEVKLNIKKTDEKIIITMKELVDVLSENSDSMVISVNRGILNKIRQEMIKRYGIQDDILKVISAAIIHIIYDEKLC